MIIVGEHINASRKEVAAAIQAQDVAEIKKLARYQLEAGAHYIDVNAGIFVDKEKEYLQWLVQTVQSEVQLSCCLDSPDPRAIEAALKVHTGTAMINSISLERERCDNIVSLIAGTNLKIVGLCMSDEGMPETADARVAIADRLVNTLVLHGVPVENIFVDPLVQPIATNAMFGSEFLTAVERIMVNIQGVHTICGLSNISYGLPERKLLNQVFLVMAITKGLDAAMINPLDRRMMASLVAAEALMGRDPYCMEYLKAFRGKKFEF